MRTNKNVTHEIYKECKVNELIIEKGDGLYEIYKEIGTWAPSIMKVVDMMHDGHDDVVMIQFEIPE